MSETNLLPCPFCGGEARHYTPGPTDHHIECRSCAADVGGYMEKAEAIAAWNARSVTAAAVMGYEAALAERTCELDGTISWEWRATSTAFYTHSLSCGHEVTTTEPEPPKYCEECGAKVVGR